MRSTRESLRSTGFGSTDVVSGLGSGAGAARATFSPLTVDISSLVGLAPLLFDEASGKVIKSVDLTGATNNKDESQTVFDLKLTDAQLVSFVITPGVGGVDASLGFDFHKATLTDQVVMADGELGKAETAIVTATHFTSPAALPDKATPVPEGSSLDYFLKIDGITGDSTDAQHKGAFAVDGFSFGSTDVVSALGSGAGAGRATFSPLT